MSARTVLVIVRSVFMAFGACALVAAIWMTTETKGFLAKASRAQGVVIDLELSRSSDSSTYKPVVRFTAADGQQIEFMTTWGSNPPAYSRGDMVEVLYLPERPQKAEIEGFMSLWGLPVIFGGLGSLFLLVGLGMVLFPMIREGRKRRLKSNGQLILAEFIGVEKDGSFEVNGRNPWRIMCQWQNPATGEVHVFASDNFWYDPTDYVTQKQINVRIDPKSPKRYWVDTEFLPAMA